MEYLCTGNVLVVDLTKGETKELELKDEWVRTGLGGAGVNLMLHEQFQESDPVVIGTGLLTATAVPGSALAVVSARSPITGRIMHSPLVNFAGTELKLAGFDYLVLHGRAPSPVYLWLHDEIADVLPADKIWGKDTWETVDFVRSEQGEDRIQVISIGPAGEGQGTMAQAVVDYWSEGDKVGFGARLGAMNLKAVGTRGMGELEIADPDATYELCLRLMDSAREKVDGKHGIDSLLPDQDLKNLADVRHRDSACSGCPWPCRTFAKYNEPPTVLKVGLKEPGMLIVDASGYVAFLSAGFDAIGAAKLLEKASRLGLEPVTLASRLRGLNLDVAKARADELARSRTDVSGVADVKGCLRPDVFSPFAPNGGKEEDIALAYLLGICPRYAALAGLDANVYSELIATATELEVSGPDLLQMARKLLR